MPLHAQILEWVHLSGLASNLWLIIALPLLGALVNGLFGWSLGRANVNLIATAAVAGSFILSLIVFWAINNAEAVAVNSFGNPSRFALGHTYGTWFAAGDFRVNFGLVVDHLSGVMLLVITGVGTLIHLYATSYMSHDKGFARFFAYLNLFVAMMLTLVMADNLVLLFVGWEGVGLCSYLLIGFWYQNKDYAWAGRKAFITNRIGDFGFLLASFLTVLLVGAFSRQATSQHFLFHGRSQAPFIQGMAEEGPLAFAGLNEMARSLMTAANAPSGAGTLTLQSQIVEGPLSGFTFGGVLTTALLLFLLGAAGKSAQIPLYVWLPDAMAGPTPVSALIHAATMVTAGVYLFCRMSSLLVLSPVAMATIALIGGATALFAALIAFAQNDIKKVLAYSTVSQLGLMFLAVGVGAFWAAIFHLVTHAFFKACLFLGAGSVMHGNADETDIKKLGGLRKEMRLTWATFLVATLAITGVVPLSGFFSKDAILHAAHTHEILGQSTAIHIAYYLGVLAAFCTAFYMLRVYLLTFEGKRYEQAKVLHAHESNWAMTTPLVVLASLSVAALLYAFPVLPRSHEPLMQNFLAPVFGLPEFLGRVSGDVVIPREHGLPWGAYLQAWIIALAGAGLAAFLYLRFYPARQGVPAPAWAQAIRQLSARKFYVDEVYEFLFIRPIKFISFVFFKVLDSLLIDTVAVRGSAWMTAQVGATLRLFQTGDAQTYAVVMALALAVGLGYAVFGVFR